MILLDTHVWIWWVSSPALLSSPARAAVNQSLVKKRIYISSMSAWEVALLVRKGRLQLTMDVGDWIRVSEDLPFIRFVPVSNSIALKSIVSDMKSLVDPIDRLIVATAMDLNLKLISKDDKIRKNAPVETIW